MCVVRLCSKVLIVRLYRTPIRTSRFKVRLMGAQLVRLALLIQAADVTATTVPHMLIYTACALPLRSFDLLLAQKGDACW